MFLGIDIGTSAVKCVLSESGTSVAAEASRPLTLSSPRAGWMEQAPEDWWQAVRDACSELSKQDGWRAVRAIGLTGQMHALVALDRTGQPVRPAILWNDSRSAPQCEEMRQAGPELGRLAGVEILPGLTAPKLRWLAENEPESWARIDGILNAKDFIGLQLHGARVTDVSDASGMWLLDQERRRWSAELCAAARIDMGWLPELREGTEVAGRLSASGARALGLPDGLPVAVGGGDTAVGAVGAGAVQRGDTTISVGTSGQIFTVTGAWQPPAGGMVHAFGHCVPDTWFSMAALLNGARPLAWFSSISGTPVGKLLERAATAREAPLFLPYLTGERTPHGDAHIRAAFVGLSDDTSQGAMARAVVDGIVYAFADGLDALRGTGLDIGSPLAIGGGARSDLLLQTLADVLGLEIRRGDDAGAGPALGAARLARVAAGEASVEEVAVAPAVSRRFEPRQQEAARHAPRLAAYRALYRALAPLAR